MSGLDVVVYGFLGFMILLGISLEIYKRANRQKMQDQLMGDTPTPDLAWMNVGSGLPTSLQGQIAPLQDTTGFTADESYLSDESGTGVAFSRWTQQFALITKYDRTIINYADIVSSEVLVDSESIIRTDRLGQIGGAVLGGVLTGGIGALVMAMGASKKQVSNVRRIDLKILTASTNPIHQVCFFKKNSWGSTHSAVYDAEKWHDLLTVAIHQAKRELITAPTQSSVVIESSRSVADELRKLADLKEQGLLSEAEFNTAKLSLLR